MNFLSLSALGIAMLIATAGLPSSSRAPSPSPILLSGLSFGPSPASLTDMASSIQITNSVTSHSQTNQLSQPYRLTVETTGRSLNAELKIDGQTVKTLTNPSETITLSSYLSTVGQHTIEIVGTYAPATATTEVLLVGPGTQISQQVIGQGTLRQTLRISVR